MPETTLRPLIICPDHAKEIIMQWLEPLTEDGTIDELHRLFVAELVPIACHAAQRAMRRGLAGQGDEVILAQLRVFLGQILPLLESVSLSPDMAAVSQPAWTEFVRAETDLRDWIYFLDHRPPASPPEATVPPSTAEIFTRAGAP